MALIMYPLPDANTFADVSVATQVAQEYFPTKAQDWGNLSTTEKEAGLLQSYMFMTTCKGLVIPDTYGQPDDSSSKDFMLAQVFLVLSGIGSSVFDIDDNSRAVTREIVGELSVTYDVRYKKDASDAPSLYYRIMSKYGCVGSSGFSVNKLERS